MRHRRSITQKARHRLTQIEREIAEILRVYPELVGRRLRPVRIGPPRPATSPFRRVQPH